MKENVRQQRSHEEHGRRLRIGDAHDTGLLCASEVTGDDLQAAPRRAVFAVRIEGHDQRRPGSLVHADDEVLQNGLLGEGDPLLGNTAKNGPGIFGGVDMLERQDARRHGDVASHGCVEQALLGFEVPQDRGRGDVKLGGNVREGGRGKALHREDRARGLKDLFPGDGGRASHL